MWFCQAWSHLLDQMLTSIPDVIWRHIATISYTTYIDGLVQDCSNASALAMARLQSCAEPSIYPIYDALLTHWGRVTHICVGNLTIIGSDNGLSPGRRQAITWTNVGILLIGPLGTNFSEMLIEIHTFSFKKIHLKMSSGKWRSFCLGFNVLTHSPSRYIVCMCQ